jgi:BirA family transcriptional regulator, biotin operon repressor / biotin---[acetyl-CoA-carboxylase] ligase
MSIIGSKIIRLKEIDSTNRYFVDLIGSERPGEGTVIMADSQTAGRGQDGTVWESAPAMNLTFSIVLYPDFLSPDAQFYLNKAISLGLADAISEILPGREDIRIKWPNDLYIGDKKLAGTLIQNGVKGSRFDFAVIGIGLNVNQDYFEGEASNPVSLKMAAGREFERDDVLRTTAGCINRRYEQLKHGSMPDIDKDYLKLLYRFQQLSDFTYKGKPIKAKITGVNRYGHLVLEIPGEKIIEVDLKEIKFSICLP